MICQVNFVRAVEEQVKLKGENLHISKIQFYVFSDHNDIMKQTLCFLLFSYDKNARTPCYLRFVSLNVLNLIQVLKSDVQCY